MSKQQDTDKIKQQEAEKPRAQLTSIDNEEKPRRTTKQNRSEEAKQNSLKYSDQEKIDTDLPQEGQEFDDHDFGDIGFDDSGDDVEPFGRQLLEGFESYDPDKDDKPSSSLSGGSKPLLSPSDLAAYLKVPEDVRRSKRFQEQLSEEVKLDPQKPYLAHDSFKDFLEFPTIAKDINKLPKGGYFPKEVIKPNNDKVFIADKIDVKSEKGNKVTVLIHRDHLDDLRAIEVRTKDGDRVLITLETAMTDRDKTTDYFPSADNNPKPFTKEEISGTNIRTEVSDEEFENIRDRGEDYEELSKKLKDSDAISEDL
jgi:hypothetical protein